MKNQHRGVRFKRGVQAMYDLRYVVCGGWCVVVWWGACAVYDGVHVRCNGRVHVRYIMHGALWVVCGLLCGAEPSRCNVLCEVSWVCCNVRVCNMGVWCMVPY